MRDMTGSTLLVTHEAADAFALADRIMVLEAGRVTQEGTPHELIAAPATPFVAAFTGAELLLDGIVVETDEGMATVRTADGATLSASAAPNPPSRGDAVHIAYRPEDVVLLGGAADARTSARNRFRLRVSGMTPVGGLLRVRLEGAPPLIALITRDAASELGLAAGVHVTALVKATALRAYPAPRGEPSP
jgi:molybdate transport system ATP-binding protein